MLRDMQLAEMSWTDAHDTAVDAVLVPVGSTEQHGPHAPLGTDWMLAESVASRGVDASEHTVLVTPTIPYGVAEEHRHFPGTVWLSPDTFRQVIRETVDALVTHGWTRIILVNGHGGNINALAEVAKDRTRSSECTCVPFTWFQSIELPSELSMGHAGAIETAAMLATSDELVDKSRLDSAAANAADRWGDWVGGVNLAVDSHEFTENGVVGDPRIATTELGEDLLTEAGNALGELIDAVVSRN